MQIQDRHRAVENYNAMVSRFVSYFTRDELFVLFRVVFRAALDESPLIPNKGAINIDEKVY